MEVNDFKHPVLPEWVLSHSISTVPVSPLKRANQSAGLPRAFTASMSAPSEMSEATVSLHPSSAAIISEVVLAPSEHRWINRC